jgi:parallel beta-helix repeat protein/predicted outer membrane repeat protein
MAAEPNGATATEQTEAIGALCHDAGVAARMMYTAEESRTTLYYAKQALTGNFRYESAVFYGSGEGNIGPALIGMINPNLDAARPVIVGITGPNIGHAVVVDGYGYDSATLYHHLNMGWEGTDDVWYNLPIIECRQEGYVFNTLVDCIYNVFDNGRGEIISGRVLAEDGRPADGATVYRSTAGHDPCEVLTNSKGIYFFDNLESDTTYTIWASVQGREFPARQVTTGQSFDHAPFSGNRWAVDFPQTLKVLYVDRRSLAGADDGSSWSNAFVDLQDALEAAANSPQRQTEIWVARGTYKPDRSTGNRELSFRLLNGVALYGGFAGGESAREQRDPAANETILTGDLRGNDGDDFKNNGENSHHVVDARGADGTATIDGFTITAGNADGDESNVQGAGILLFYSKSVISNCKISRNRATVNGGGIYSQDSNPRLTNCTFSDNAAAFGAAMMNYDSSAALSNCEFSGNAASETGGGMLNHNSSPTVTFCVFTGNSASSGAGMSCQKNSNAAVSNCDFVGNRAIDGGGAIYIEASDPSVRTCKFRENSARYGGGMAYMAGGDISVSSCEFTANTADQSGGAIYCQDRNLTADSCKFSENSARYGGAVACSGNAEVSVSNCEFDANRATDNGGGVSVEGSKLTAEACKFRENSSKFGGGMINLNSVEVSVSNCEFGSNRASENGGGIYSQSSKSTVRASTFSENSAGSGGGISIQGNSDTFLSSCGFVGNDVIASGGGIYNQRSNLSLTDCTVSNNSAQRGGGLLNFEGSVSLSSCILTGNNAILYGGAVFNETGNSAMSNCTFAANAADAGGGAFNGFGSTPIFTNCNLISNEARMSGGGGGILNYENSVAVLSNCIMWSNINGQLGGSSGGDSKVTYSNVEGGFAGEGNINSEPFFADPDKGDYHLKSQGGRWDPTTQMWVTDNVTSPCVDKGDPSTPLGAEPWPNGGIINMGAYGGTAEASKTAGN